MKRPNPWQDSEELLNDEDSETESAMSLEDDNLGLEERIEHLIELVEDTSAEVESALQQLLAQLQELLTALPGATKGE